MLTIDQPKPIVLHLAMLSPLATPLSYMPNSYMKRKIFQYPKAGCYFTDTWTGSSVKLHPSDIAIAPRSGHLAICAYELNAAGLPVNGHLLIWKKLTDFCNHKNADYHYKVNGPLALAFDNNEALYISSAKNGTIHFTETIHAAPVKMFRLESAAPRGMAFDDENNMYAMCGSSDPCRQASILKISHQGDPFIRDVATMIHSEQSGKDALAVTIWDNKLYTTDLNGLAARTSVNRYIIEGNILINKESMPDTCGYAGMTMGITSDCEHVYFTSLTDGNAYVTQWDTNSISPHPTRKFKLGPATAVKHSVYGIAVYEGFIIVADTARRQIRILHESQLEH